MDPSEVFWCNVLYICLPSSNIPPQLSLGAWNQARSDPYLRTMSLPIDHEFDSEAIIPVGLSSLPTTPAQSLTGSTDRLEVESSGTRTSVGDDSDSDIPVGTRPIKSICCVGAGYVGTFRGCMILILFLVTYRLTTNRRSNCCCHCIQKPAYPSHRRWQRRATHPKMEISTSTYIRARACWNRSDCTRWSPRLSHSTNVN